MTTSSSVDGLHSAWLGWFPVLFYTSLYVGDFYRRSASASSTVTAEYIEAEANRLGSRAMTISAILTLLTNFAAPILVSKRKGNAEAVVSAGPKPWYKRKMHMATIWALSHMFFAVCMFATLCVGSFVCCKQLSSPLAPVSLAMFRLQQ